MNEYEIIFDIGSKYVSAGLVQDDFYDKIPAVVAVNTNDNKQVIGVGANAFNIKRSGVKYVYPIMEGTIVDVECAKALFNSLIARVLPAGRNTLSRYYVKCIVPCGTVSSDKKILESTFLSMGARQVLFVETPIADSAELFRRFRAKCGIVVDIGNDCTDIAVVNDYSIYQGATLYHSAKQLTQAIAGRIKDKYMVSLTPMQAEALKLHCASLYSNDSSTYKLVGQNIKTNAVETIDVSSKELYDTVVEFVKTYISVIKSLVSTLPPELSTAVKTEGVMLCGGGAKLSGLDIYLQNELALPVRIAENAEDISIIGGIQLEKQDAK